MPDDIDVYDRARLAAVYDLLDPDRTDLDVYVDLVAEFGGRRLIDLGCGTGTFALKLTGRGIHVTAVDLDEDAVGFARHREGADAVEWVVGDASDLSPMAANLITMTGNFVQNYVTDAEWDAALAAIRDALLPGGYLIFESRRPEARAWDGWTPERTRVDADVEGIGPVSTWQEVLDVADHLVNFRSSSAFEDGTVIEVDTTLRFRTEQELRVSLAAAGFETVDVRDAPDRPGSEFVFIARVADEADY